MKDYEDQSARVLIVSTMRNEAPYIIEWIAHLLGAGANQFLIFSNDCDDGTDDLLDCLARAGVVTHIRHTPDPERSIQWQALRAAWKHPMRRQANWALVCDVDEFIHIRTPSQDFQSLIDALPGDADAMALPWRLFGAPSVRRDVGALVCETCTKAMTEAVCFPIAATMFKTLFHLDGPFNQFGVHRPSQKSLEKARMARWVDGSGALLPKTLAQNGSRISLLGTDAGRGLADLHHYSVRSAPEFVVKRHRGLPHNRHKDLGLRYWVERNFTTVQDQSIAPMMHRAAPIRARLMALPGVAEQYARGLRWHREAFEVLMQDEAVYQLYCDLCLVGGSKEIGPQEAEALYRGYQARFQGKSGD